MKSKIIIIAGFGCTALTFWGCGDNVTEQIIQSNDGLESVAAINDLPKCAGKNAGAMAFVSDSAKVYYCADSSWQLLNGKDGEDGTDGKDGAQGKDGKNGTNGVDGSNGVDGANCVIEALTDKLGYKVICGEDSVGVILNGDKGEQGIQGNQGEKGETGNPGKDGSDGIDCSLTDNGDGTVAITCGDKSIELNKAVCGSQVYDPANKFCHENILYDYCAGNAYDPANKFCHENILYDYCAGNAYDPANKFCYENILYDYCDGKVYNPTELQCKSNQLVFTDTRGSGKEYKVAKIGTQVWMAENLNYNIENSYCYYDENIEELSDSLANCAKYGRLYTWNAAKTACPDGWHLPSDEEWNVLLNFVLTDNNLGTTNEAGTYLKSTTDWNSYSGIPTGIDKYGFNALPAGSRYFDGSYNHMDEYGNFWSFTDYSNDAANLYILNYDDERLFSNGEIKSSAISVRCLKDSD